MITYTDNRVMTPKECLVSALKRRTPTRIPTFEWFIDTVTTKALCDTDDVVEAVERLDIDGVNVRCDYSKEWQNEDIFVDEWGIVKRLTGDILPAAIDYPIKNIADQADYAFPALDAPHRFQTLERAVEKYGDRRAVILNLRDGFSDMRDLLGYENALMAMVVEKAHFTDLLKRVVDYNLALAERAVKRYGIEIVATTDDVCTARGPIMRPATYADVIAPYFKEVIQGYHDLGLITIKHCDGNVTALLDYWLDAGIDCLDPIDPTGGLDMGVMKEKYGDRLCLKGNIDCTGNLCNGTPEQVDEEVRVCIEKAGKSGLIVSSSNTIHRGVKPENYQAMLHAIKKYS